MKYLRTTDAQTPLKVYLKMVQWIVLNILPIL